MSKDKYPSIFSPQMEAVVFIMLQILFATRAIFKIGGYSRISPSFSWGVFGHVTCLDQSRVFVLEHSLFFKARTAHSCPQATLTEDYSRLGGRYIWRLFFIYALTSKTMKTLELHYIIGNGAYS